MLVLIASAEQTARDAFGVALRGAGISTVSAGDGATALALMRRHRPEVTLLDDELPGLGGISALARLEEEMPDARVVMIAGRYETRRGVHAVVAGAAGYLSRDIPPEALPRVVRGVMRGGAAVSRTLAMALVEQMQALARNREGMRPVRSPLTPREWEVLDLLTTGASPQEISHELVVSVETVQSHIKRMLRKLGVHSRGAAIARARELRRHSPKPAER
jgi:two-component system, NarL family, response regulator LiaR